jgi:hypothetical protein
MAQGTQPSCWRCARVTLTAINRRRENETTQNRNARNLERRWVLEHEQGKLERTMAPWPACPSDSDRCDASAEHTLRRELIPTQATRRRSPPPCTTTKTCTSCLTPKTWALMLLHKLVHK